MKVLETHPFSIPGTVTQQLHGDVCLPLTHGHLTTHTHTHSQVTLNTRRKKHNHRHAVRSIRHAVNKTKQWSAVMRMLLLYLMVSVQADHFSCHFLQFLKQKMKIVTSYTTKVTGKNKAHPQTET